MKLGDFGVATKLNNEGQNDNTVAGSVYWMAPEVVEMSSTGTASDIWSLGCTVIELLEGKPPNYGLPPMNALFRIVQEDRPPIPDNLSPSLTDFLFQCFQRDPHLRVTAEKLIKHSWLQLARSKQSETSQQNHVKTEPIMSNISQRVAQSVSIDKYVEAEEEDFGFLADGILTT